MDGGEQDAEDRILIQRFLDGEQAAFEQLVERYYRRIDRLAQRIVGHPTAAEDITQETFLRAYRAISRFRGESSFYSWLYRIALNLCLNYLRRQPHSSCAAVDPPNSRAGGSVDPATLMEDRERERLVRSAIDSLPPHYRVVVVLRDLEDLSYQEIARLLAIPIGTVKSRINYAKRLLKEKLGTLLDRSF